MGRQSTKEKQDTLKMYPLLPTPNMIFRNRGDLTFQEMGSAWGYDSRQVTHAIALADFDNDGDLDLIMNTINASPCLLRNDGGNQQSWLKVVPVRNDTGMVALGSTVTVKAGGSTQLQPVLAVNGYLTSSDPRPHFGLGKATLAESVEILWPDGQKQALTGVKANQILHVKQEGK
jgi:hypothetical protein